MSRIAIWVSADHLTFMEKHERILFFDGVCNLCNGLVRFVIKHDRHIRIKFAPLQSDIAGKILTEYDVIKTDSVIYLSGDRIFYRSEAILRMFLDMGGAWKLLYGFIVLPRFLRDFIYDLIARNRYRIFGRRESCMVPTPDVKGRFL